MPARLVDLESGRAWELLAEASAQGPAAVHRFRINCKPSADVTLSKPWISKHHAQVRHEDGAWWVEDGGSVNTVTVNGQRAPDRRQLADGDVLGLGRTSLRFETDGEPPAPRDA